jgi:integrase/recombinase XerD
MLETVHNDNTKNYYTYCLDKFRDSTGLELDDLVELDIKQVTRFVQNYIISLKSKVSPNSIPIMVAPIKRFCYMNDIMLNWKRMEYFFPEQIKLTGQSAWQTSDIQKMLSVATKLSIRAMIHMLASSGCRVGGIVGLRIKDITNVAHGCKMIKVYAGDKEEYTTFLTPEASYAYDQYIQYRMDSGKEVTSESYVFSHYARKNEPLPRTGVNAVLARIVKKTNIRGDVKQCGIDGKGVRYNTQLLHGFRKRFNTILKENNEVNDNAIEKMMGHKNGLDATYLQIPDERLLEHFMKGAIDLTVSDDHRFKLETKKLQKENQELEAQLEERIKLQDEKIERFEKKYRYLDAPEEYLK